MRVPLSWLREYVDFDLTSEELVELFSLYSQEVDGVERLGVLDGEVVVGEVLEFGPHPNADRLSVAKVDLGGEEVQIVAGAPNPYPGARVPVVLPGSVMADGTKLKKAKLRGLESYGMMMSERELGISQDHTGILLLDESYEVGRPVADYFPVGEVVLDVDVMPNRPDLWGMIGVARELAAILRTDFRIPEPRFEASGEPTNEYGLRVEDPDLCPRYDLRRVSGVTAGRRSPLDVRRKVFAAGMRPINAIVDATNYVMLETGQPIHAFDAARIKEGIVVRRVWPGERLTLLDGSVRELEENMLVIADEERGRAIAGVMGGEDAEVGEDTTDVLIEVANFNGRNVFETSQRLGIRTDASGRFERGLDPNMVDYAMDRVTGMLTEHAGGRAADDTLSHYPEPVEPWEVPLRLNRAELLLGMPVEEDEVTEILNSLGCRPRSEDGKIAVEIPTFRRDLRREADLIEEVGRLVGLDLVPEELPRVPQPGGLTPLQRETRNLRRLLSDLGLAEAITYPFGPHRWWRDLGTDGNGGLVEIENPLSREGSKLRTTLLPGLLDAAARNRAFGVPGGALFEVGSAFIASPSEDRDTATRFRFTGVVSNPENAYGLMGVEETSKVAVVLAGTIQPAGWNSPERRAGFFEAKGIIERLVPEATFEARNEPFLHPGRSACVLIGGEEAGWIGELHPEVAERFGLEGWPVAALELGLEFCEPDPELRFQVFTNVPAVVRDLAVVVDDEVRAGALVGAVEALDSPLLNQVRVFDVYEGSQVPEGKKSLALSFTFQGEETLTDEAVDAEVGRVAELLEKEFGARIRG
ncbi:MAG TPA: phenylalanine--tRNA ligase subunit beta [Rubrobacteraceae bacterium]|nr:phenylalanine--tRNA ligase subunit beta [Rubrobacteraceae bacterium]